MDAEQAIGTATYPTVPAQAGPEAAEIAVRDMATADALAMHMLAAHIPLTLILDLAENFGPPSAEILASEGNVERPRWLVAAS